MAILSEEDLAFWRTHGFVVARQVISAEQAARTADEIWEFASRPEHRAHDFGLDRADEESWYEKTLDSRRGHVEIYHGPNQWANRTSPGVHEAFSQVLGSTEIVCSKDRANITPPSRNPEERVDSLHWDAWPIYAYNRETHGQHIVPEPGHASVWDTLVSQVPEWQRMVDGHWVQGVLYLTDVPEDAGGINCSPRGPEAVKEWLQQLPPDSKPAEADLVALFKPQPVPGKAGDLVIWHSLNPHITGVNHNQDGAVRVVQYVTYSIAGAQSRAARQGAVDFWREGQVGNGNRLGMPNEPGGVALTPLGRRIAQLDPWPGLPGARL